MTAQSEGPVGSASGCGARAAERHFDGTYVRMVLDHVRAHVGPEAVDHLLAGACQTRTADEVTTGRVSYDELRTLLERAAELLGGPRGLFAVGLHTVLERAGSLEYTETLQSLGSPAALYANYQRAAARMSNVARVVGVEETGATEWLIRMAFDDGFEPFESYCWFMGGTLTITPRLWGYPPADVVEVECQRHGAQACTYRVRWQELSDDARRAEHFEGRSRLLEARLESLQRTVGELVSTDDLPAVLDRIVASTARAVRAPAYVLAIDALPDAPGAVYTRGLDDDEAEAIAAQLLAADGSSSLTRLVVDVASQRGRYGRLAAIDPNGVGFFPQELATLEVYARLAATALDSATALDDARRQAATATALLELSTAMAELVSTDEMAARIARAVPAVVDCDRALVALTEAGNLTARVVASHGYPDELDTRLRSMVFDIHDGRWPAPRDEGTVEIDQAISDLSGSAAATRAAIVGNGEVIGWVVAAVCQGAERLQGPDVTERLRGLAAQAATAITNARLLDQIRHQALHDSLTALPNRELILDRVEQMLARTRRHHSDAAALFIDLDGFKSVNDTLGHEAGDALLKAVAIRFASALRASDTLGRLGGDEFVVLAEDVSPTVGAELVAERLQQVLHDPFHLEGLDNPLTVTASIGIAKGDRPSGAELLRDADVALYRAKATGKNRYVVFHPDMHTAARDRLELETDLRSALNNGQFFLVYQPVFNLDNVRVTGVEALLRWNHPQRGVLGPDAFIPMLEDTGRIVEVGRWVLHEACRQGALWSADGHRLAVSVNVSMRQLESDCLIDDVRNALATSGLAAESLIIEVTETALMQDTEQTIRRLTLLKTLGVKVAIDDFGTGYSSLAYLKQFPVDSLKIDRSFISGMTDSPESMALIHTLIQLGRALGLETLAEGIEEQHQLAHLQGQHCDSGQGFLLAHPLTTDAVATFVAHWREQHATSTAADLLSEPRPALVHP